MGDHAVSKPAVTWHTTISGLDKTDFGVSLVDSISSDYAEFSSGDPITSIASLEGRQAHYSSWPDWVHPELVDHFSSEGISRPWSHQAQAAQLIHSGSNTVIATATASGKSLCYQLPALSALAEDKAATVLYLSPTKALGRDQVSSLTKIIGQCPSLHDVFACTYDGDTPAETRTVARNSARWISTNPDMLNLSLLAHHARWKRFWKSLRFIVIDESHYYRGVFGSAVALLMRRVARVARHYGSSPVFIATSATTVNPAESAAELIGQSCQQVTKDGSPQGSRTIVMWDPPSLTATASGQVEKRAAAREAAGIVASLAHEGARCLAFVRSRAGAEQVADNARKLLADRYGEQGAAVGTQVASYRAGYLPQERRELEAKLNSGELVAAASTSALELGIDIAGLDAVISVGFPGTVASFWQQAGRAGRRGQGAVVVFIARDDPLDTYLVNHPKALIERPVERTVVDPSNEVLLAKHLVCAAVEAPLTHADVDHFRAAGVVQRLVVAGKLRQRGERWFPSASLTDPHRDVDIRGGGGEEVVIVDGTDGRVIGTADRSRALSSLFEGAVYLHQGESFVVDHLDVDELLCVVHADTPLWTTRAITDRTVRITAWRSCTRSEDASWGVVDVDVTSYVRGYEKRLKSDNSTSIVDLDFPPQVLSTKAVVYTITMQALEEAGVGAADIPGALHAAEHAAIGLLPLLASCDRWDIGGLSTNLHPDTSLPTVFVYDGYSGGAGYAQRGHDMFARWLEATSLAVSSCPCLSGCPSCIQSPKCGNGNEPLDKDKAVKVLELMRMQVLTHVQSEDV